MAMRNRETGDLRGSGRLLTALGALALLLLIGASPGCSSEVGGDGTAEAATDGDEKKGDKKNGEKKDEKKETAVPVEVAVLERGEIRTTLRSSANLEAENQVKVYSQAARLVRDLRVEEGVSVRKGDLLVRLQDEEQRSALSKVQAQHDKAARDYEMQKKLHANELISDETFNTFTYEVEQLRISLEDAKRELTYTEVRAPISGIITGRHVQVGDRVTVGQHLFDLVDFNSIVARIYVPEKELPRLRPGLPARIRTQGAGENPSQGRVSRISPIVDPQTGTIKVTVAFDGHRGIRPGMYVDVELVTDKHQDALLVPKRALIYDQDQVFVYRLGEERRVERLLLEPVLEDKINVEPAEGGLNEGDQIVVAGQAGLKDKSLVRLPGDPIPDKEKDDPTKVAKEDAR